MGNFCTCGKVGRSKDSMKIKLDIRETKQPNHIPVSVELEMDEQMNKRINRPVDHYYDMNHKNRGVALIFNHEEFDDTDWSVRHGTRADCDNLIKTFTALNFDVRVYEDLTKSEVKNILQRVSAEDHSDNDCFVVILMTHGEMLPVYNKALDDECNTVLSHDLVSYILAKDQRFALRKVFKYFTNENCPTLAKKPRLFFIQACQGSELDEGAELHRPVGKEIKIDSSPYKLKQPILPHEDFFIAYASLPGFASFRNNIDGSWFIQALCRVLNQFKYQYDLMHILTITCQTVAYEFESKSLDPSLDKMKQMPCIQSMLTKLVAFEEKQPNKLNNEDEIYL